MTSIPKRLCLLVLAPLFVAGAAMSVQPESVKNQKDNKATEHVTKHAEESTMNVYYLEIVTPSMDETCETLAKVHGVTFGDPVPELGNARTATLSDGGRIGVRKPLRSNEEPVVRPYVLVEDIHAAAKSAEDAGAQIALPPMEIPGQGTISIYILGGIEHGLWQR